MEAEIRPLQKFEYLAPGSIGEVITLLKDNADDVTLIAGGTDLLVWMKTMKVSPGMIVGINGIPELSFVDMRDDYLHIGAATPLNVVRESQQVQQKTPLLAEAIGSLASYPIRNRATIGGNLCSASPAADTAPPLLALDASVILQGPKGERTIPLSEFFLGPGQTVRGPDEILREVKIPWREGRSAFLKLGRRKGFTLSIASAAAFGLVRDGKFEDIKVAVGAVAPIPIRSRKVEEALKDAKATEEEIERAADMIKEDVNPITDLRASAAYRREMACLLTKRAVKKIAIGQE